MTRDVYCAGHEKKDIHDKYSGTSEGELPKQQQQIEYMIIRDDGSSGIFVSPNFRICRSCGTLTPFITAKHIKRQEQEAKEEVKRHKEWEEVKRHKEWEEAQAKARKEQEEAKKVAKINKEWEEARKSKINKEWEEAKKVAEAKAREAEEEEKAKAAKKEKKGDGTEQKKKTRKVMNVKKKEQKKKGSKMH